MTQLTPGPRFQPNPPSIKAAVFDIDNTLVPNDSSDLPSERFKQAVHGVRGKITVGLASARPLSKAEHILDYIQAEGLTILCNGAQIIDSKTKAVIAEFGITPASCAELVSFIESIGAEYWINDDGVDYFPSQDKPGQYSKQLDIWNKQSPRQVVPDYKFIKPFMIVSHDVSDQQVAQMRQQVAQSADKNLAVVIAHEWPQPDGTKTYDAFFVHQKGNKKDALHFIAEYQGISVDALMAVGDGHNDAVIVGAAGVGVAMGNSVQETLDVATYIAADRASDGAAIALEAAASDFA